MITVLVFAGNQQEARFHINGMGSLKLRFKYVSSRADILGMNPKTTRYWKVGTWYTNDAASFLDEIKHIPNWEGPQ